MPFRRLLIALIVATGVLVVDGPVARAACGDVAGSYDGGTGTVADPYLIDTPEHLERLRSESGDWGSAFRLTSDLNMGGCTWSSGIGSFTGILDGDYHVISNLNLTTYAFILNVWTNGIVRNLGLDITMTYTASSTHTDPSDTSQDLYAGGLTGRVGGTARLENVWTTGSASVSVSITQNGNSNALLLLALGGVAGAVEGVVIDSWSSMSVSLSGSATATTAGKDATTRNFLGGVVGWLASSTSASLARSYGTSASLSQSASAIAFSGSAFLDSRRGSLVGYDSTSLTPPALSRNVWDGDRFLYGVDGGFGVAGATRKTTSEMNSFDTFGPAGEAWDITDGWSRATTWSICSRVNSGYPFHSLRYTTNPCIDPPGPAETPALPLSSKVVDVTVRPGAVEVVFERVHRGPTTSWYQVEDSTGRTCRALHDSVGATGSCTFDARTINDNLRYRVTVHNVYGASEPSAWSPYVIVGRPPARTEPATPQPKTSTCPAVGRRTVTSGVRDVVTIGAASCPVAVSLRSDRSFAISVGVPTNLTATEYVLVASRARGSSVKRTWSAPSLGFARTTIGPLKSGDWTIRLEVRGPAGPVTSWTSPVVAVK